VTDNNISIVDLRSDTVTCPNEAMREAMFQAPVGDDVMGEDPTVNKLEQYAAELCGKEAAVYVPSGTMANQATVRAWCRNGDEILIMPDSHLFFYEAGSAAGLSGVQLNQIPSVNGSFSVSDFEAGIRPNDDPHFPLTKLFWVENTHNRGGGKIVPFDKLKSLYNLAQKKNIPLHIDGARLVNASVATGIALSEWAQVCDSLSLCLSKGLGAPVGSIIIGSKPFIKLCRRARKALGGGMRQAGIIAAAGLYALQNNIERLSVDHDRACSLAEELRKIKGLQVPETVDTNILMIDLDSSLSFGAEELALRLELLGIRLFSINRRRLRAVFHLNLNENSVDMTVKAFRKALS